MEPLNETLAALIAEETAAVEPPAGAKTRHWAAVAGAFGVAATAAGTASATSAATSAATVAAKSGALLKVVGTTIIGGVLAATAWSVSRPDDRERERVAEHAGAVERDGDDGGDDVGPVPAAAAAGVNDALQPEVSGAAAELDESPEPVTEVPASQEATQPDARPAPPPEAKPRPPRTSRPPDEPPAAGLAQELALVESMRKAVIAGQHRRALTLARRHRDEFPDGALQPDRLDLEASAHCGAGDVDRGRALAATLAKRWPRSPTSDRLRRSCDLETE